jgi:hypothetical protein
MNDTTVWIIALAFYAPMHFLGPALVGFLSGWPPCYAAH